MCILNKYETKGDCAETDTISRKRNYFRPYPVQPTVISVARFSFDHGVNLCSTSQPGNTNIDAIISNTKLIYIAINYRYIRASNQVIFSFNILFQKLKELEHKIATIDI